MDDRKQERHNVDQADGGPGREPSVPGSEEGTGIVPGDDEARKDTHLPASEDDTDVIEKKEEGPPPQSWPGRGPSSIPPPG